MKVWRRWGGSLPLLLRIAGLLWIVTLVFGISDWTFFTGDAGLKALQVQQFAQGRPGLSLDLGEPAFAQGPYQEGFFPFKENFVYRIAGRYFSAFPIALPVLTAPFAALFGFRGLYVWPLLGLWLAWEATDRLAVSYHLGPGCRSAALGLLIFCSPLSLYGALFWEHTLAAGLVSIGWAILATAGSGAEGNRAARGCVAGLAFGSAVWLREETLLLALLIGVAALGSLLTEAEASRIRIAELAGLAVPVLLWLGFNQIAYGTFLGLRSVQLTATQVAPWDLVLAKDRLFQISRLLVTFFPPVLLVPVLVGTVLRSMSAAAALRGPLLTGLAFWCLVPLGLPNEGGKQWGPRYLLPLLPLFAVALAVLLDEALRRSPRRFGPAVAVALLGLAFPGLRLNMVEGSETILSSSRSRAEPLRLVRADPRAIVVVSHQFTSQQLAGAFGEKTFFLAWTGRGLKRLADQLGENGRRDFLYLCDPVYPCPLALEGLPERAEVASDYGSSDVTLTRLGEWGRYMAYRGEISAR